MRRPRWLARREESRGVISLEQWASYFQFGGHTYPITGMNQTLTGREEEISRTFAGYAEGIYKRNGVVFACMVTRAMLFAEARFRFRRLSQGRPGELFGTSALGLLEEPWTGATTGDLLARSLQDVDLGGNNFWTRRPGDILQRLRPDWVTIVAGSPSDPTANRWALDSELLGYVYQPGGPGGGADPVVLLPEQVAHFAPYPDPTFRFRGMSWLDPLMREILGDSAAMSHKLKFFESGATPNMIVTMDPSISPASFKEWMDLFQPVFEARHEGMEHAYKTLMLGGGATATVVGSDMQQIDFKTVQGHGETRIAAAAGVPPVIVGLSEGLEAATYSNYAQARRRFADMTIRPLWRNFAGSISGLVGVPPGAELWYDDRDIPALQEDLKDAAEIQNRESDTITRLIREGFTPESVIVAVENANWSLLKHSGLVSVQLHGPGETPALGNGNGPAMLPAGVPDDE